MFWGGVPDWSNTTQHFTHIACWKTCCSHKQLTITLLICQQFASSSFGFCLILGKEEVLGALQWKRAFHLFSILHTSHTLSSGTVVVNVVIFSWHRALLESQRSVISMKHQCFLEILDILNKNKYIHNDYHHLVKIWETEQKLTVESTCSHVIHFKPQFLSTMCPSEFMSSSSK